MADLTRISISLENRAAGSLRPEQRRQGLRKRAARPKCDFIRERLIREEPAVRGGSKTEQVAVVTLVYDHHARELAARLIDKQHHHHTLVVSTMHVHLGESTCSGSVGIARSRRSGVRNLGEELLAVKGVLHGEITYTGGERAFSRWGGEHGHPH